MFSNVTVGLICAVGAGAWVYVKMMKSTGNNVQSSLTVAIITGFFSFLIFWTLMGMIPGI